MIDLSQIERYDPNGYYDFRNQFARETLQRSMAAFSAGEKAKDAIADGEALRAYQGKLRSFLLKAMGGLPESGPLNAHKTGVLREGGLSIENIVFESRPRSYVTANLYLPDGAPGAAVLFLCGHAEPAKQYPLYQQACRVLAKAGLIVLAVDPVGQGERRGYWGESDIWGSMEHDLAGIPCFLTGACIARYFLHDAMRAIDYLLTRPGVDPLRIGVTGQSGGGTQTCLMMLCDPRIAAAAPATFVTGRLEYMLSGGAQDAEQIWPGFTSAGYDHEDMLVAMAPRPALVLAAEYDFFPVEGARRSVERARRVYELLDRGGNLELFTEATTHQYSEAMASRAAEFFSRRLLDRPAAATGFSTDAIDPARLQCTRSGQVKTDYTESLSVFEENNALLDALEADRSPANGAECAAEALAWLRERAFTGRSAVSPNLRVIEQRMAGNLDVQLAFWRSRASMFHYGCLFRDAIRVNEALPPAIGLWRGGTKALEAHREWIARMCGEGFAVLVPDLTGDGNLLPHAINGYAPDEDYGAVHKLADDLLWLGDSLAAVRTFDLIRAADALQTWPGIAPGRVRVHAEGLFGVYARLAAALVGNIGTMEPDDQGGGSFRFADLVRSRHAGAAHAMEIVLPGVLRRFDLPDLERACPGGESKIM